MLKRSPISPAENVRRLSAVIIGLAIVKLSWSIFGIIACDNLLKFGLITETSIIVPCPLASIPSVLLDGIWKYRIVSVASTFLGGCCHVASLSIVASMPLSLLQIERRRLAML